VMATFRSPRGVAGIALGIVMFISVAALRVNRTMQSQAGKQRG
jgi:hypothetical protein